MANNHVLRDFLTPGHISFSFDDFFEPVTHVEVLHRLESLPRWETWSP